MPDESGFDDSQRGSGIEVAPAEPKVKQPSLYRVVVLNDDYTPRDFVVVVLQQFFDMGREKAYQIMMAVHRTGSGVAGIYTREIAETKSEQVNRFAQEHQHPLKTTIEEIDSD